MRIVNPVLGWGRHLVPVLAVLALAACDNAPTASAPPPETPQQAEDEEYGEFYASPDELAAYEVNDIARSMRLNVTAKKLGEEVYNKNCASCHGADLKGAPGKNAPDLTDSDWRFAGDDLETGGGTKYPADVEWTVRFGIRAGHRNSRGRDADMVAFDPQYRNAEDTKDLGNQRFISDEEISDVVDYVLQLSGQEADSAKAARGKILFHDSTKGNCNDCHSEGGVGEQTLGSTNLTQPKLYLYGADRASILESINRGRSGTMPGFDSVLKPEEIKAVSIFVFWQARK